MEGTLSKRAGPNKCLLGSGIKVRFGLGPSTQECLLSVAQEA
jgi:hypothetical protein